MNIAILGASGMLGRKLTSRIVEDGGVGKAADSLFLRDVVQPHVPDGAPFPIFAETSDLNDPGEAERIVADRPDLIFHLAAVLSGEAESDFEKGYRVNLDGTRGLFEAIRKVGDGYRPKVVFSSTIAVFGSPYPDLIDD